MDATPDVNRMRLSKHEGLGNDFLVLLDPQSRTTITPERVAQLCDRRRGVGADGLLRATAPGAEGVDAAMELYNADGTRAEMSGNGIRCLAQALLLDRWARPPAVVIATDAGIRTVRVDEGPNLAADGRTIHHLSVDMGTVERLGDAPEWALTPSTRAAWASAGNPHLVVEVDSPAAVAQVDLVELGQKVNAAVPGGANVHLLAAGPDAGEVTVRTYERGVGLTEACGTGACASAATAADWGLTGDPGAESVAVHMPGGQARVTLPAGTGGQVVLTGPAASIATVESPWP